jgi:putative chitinase
MAPLTVAQLAQIIPGIDGPRWIDVLNKSMEEFDIVTPPRVAAFVAQVAHESGGLRRLVESLNYSAAALRRTWPSRFPTDALALEFARQEEKIANFVYANRLGNGDTASGDGFRFRGRGLIQVTGRSNYQTTGSALTLRLLEQPELLEQPAAAARSAAQFWRSRGLNELADVSGDRMHDEEDFLLITKRINGGTVGKAERLRLWTAAKTALGIA